VVIFSEAALYRQVKSFVGYYQRSKAHLSVEKDSPESRAAAVTPTRKNHGYSASLVHDQFLSKHLITPLFFQTRLLTSPAFALFKACEIPIATSTSSSRCDPLIR